MVVGIVIQKTQFLVNIYISRQRQHNNMNINLENDQQNLRRLGTVSKRNICTGKLQQVSLLILIWL